MEEQLGQLQQQFDATVAVGRMLEQDLSNMKLYSDQKERELQQLHQQHQVLIGEASRFTQECNAKLEEAAQQNAVAVTAPT